MPAPAGSCEWCGGAQRWKFLGDVMYVMCLDGCLPLDLEGLVPPPDSELGPEEIPNSYAIGTVQERGGSKPPEGGDRKESDDELPW